MIHIVDYGLGNIQAFVSVFSRLGIPVVRACVAGDLTGATHVILPGVGHFDSAMRLLNQSGMRPALEKIVIGKGVHLLGVCVGMQMLAEGSDEGISSGLKWIPGRVRSFANYPNSSGLPTPHMGWNQVQPRIGGRLFDNVDKEVPEFYFLHSFYFDPLEESDVAATAKYGFEFCSVVSRGNVHGVQFHPEKSHNWGAQFLLRFANL